jgi:hypothetical protein
MNISTILDHIDSGQMALPEFQRGYVWNCDPLRRLFDLLYNRRPVGGLMVWATESQTAIHRGDGPLPTSGIPPKLRLDINVSHMAVVHCKPYHRPLKGSDSGNLRSISDRKSQCPGWLGDEQLRQKLLDEALPDPKGEQDFLERPKKVWNAINGVYFIGVSTNEPDLKYNCYPEQPTCLLEDLNLRAGRSLEEFRTQP